MAKDTQRDKARATFGKTFFENSKALPNPKNSMAALQARANARPIPTFKVGGVVKKADGGRAGKDFTKPMMEAAARAAKKGTPVMKDGGVMEERLKARMKAGNYKDGGKAESRYERKMKDIEKDFRIAMAKGKDADVAKAKMNQRIADAKDDLAKATKADRTATKAAEKAAERELTMTRRYGAAKPTESMKDKPIAAPKAMSDADMAAVSAMKPAGGLSAVSQKAKAAAPARKPVSAPPRMQGRVAARQAQAAPQQRQAPAEKPTLQGAFERAQQASKPAPIANTGRTPRLLSADTKGTTPPRRPLFGEDGVIAGTNSAKTRAAKLEAMRAAAEAPGASALAKSRYETAKRTGMYAKGGEVGKYAAGGAGKVRKGMMKGK